VVASLAFVQSGGLFSRLIQWGGAQNSSFRLFVLVASFDWPFDLTLRLKGIVLVKRSSTMAKWNCGTFTKKWCWWIVGLLRYCICKSIVVGCFRGDVIYVLAWPIRSTFLYFTLTIYFTTRIRLFTSLTASGKPWLAILICLGQFFQSHYLTFVRLILSRLAFAVIILCEYSL
jgi:hypothetical protein